MRVLILTLFLLLGWLQYRLWVGEGSLAEVHALKADIVRQTQELAALRARNQALAAEVANLQAGNEALEEHARADLGMIKPGEVFLQEIEGQPGNSKPGAASALPAPASHDAGPSLGGAGAPGIPPILGGKPGVAGSERRDLGGKPDAAVGAPPRRDGPGAGAIAPRASLPPIPPGPKP
jgi:cell division protein FtsB